MRPGAVQEPRKRNSARARVSGALGVSVALHVLGGVALWRGALEPERRVPDRPLEVQLVWREASRSTGLGPVLSEAPASPPARPGRPRKVDTARTVEPPAPVPAAAPSEPELRVSEPPSVDPSAAVASGVPGEVAGTGSEVSSPSGVSGGGASTGAGSGGGSTPGGQGSGVASELMAYREQLSRRVTRQRRYPAQAVRLGLEGTVLVRVRINHDGALAEPPRLEDSSRFRVLDAEALRMVEEAAPFAPLPAELSRGPAEFVIPVSFSLRAAG